MKKRVGVPVSARALLQRINRELAKDNGRTQVKKTRGRAALEDVGEYYELDLYANVLVRHHINLEALGRKLGVLSAWEHLVDDRAV
jgi:hypothetical protein